MAGEWQIFGVLSAKSGENTKNPPVCFQSRRATQPVYIVFSLLVRGKRKAAARQIRRFSSGPIHFVHRFLTEVMS